MTQDAASIPDESKPMLSSVYRLQFEPAQDQWVLLYPEGMVKLNAPASEILKRCDGQHSVADIVTELQTVFGQADLSSDVRAFLVQAQQRSWLR